MSQIRNTIYLGIGLSLVLTAAINGITYLEGDVAPKIAAMQAGTANPYREFNEWINSLFFGALGLKHVIPAVMEKYGHHLGYYICCYCRDLVMGSMVYWCTAGLWHLAIYHVFSKKIFYDKNRPFPTWATFFDQMTLAQASLFVYAGLPVFSEFLIESGYTKVYFYLDEIGGWKNYIMCLIPYIFCVELGVYWVHRKLHEVKFLYKYVHGLHHKYNNHETMTPWCSIAFNPIDGIMQASPWVFFLLFFPVHYFTHVFLLFFTGVWATNIHDAMWGDSEPVMGSKYHTLHHTHYHFNYGQFFTFSDYFFGTLRPPVKAKFE